MLYDYSGFPAHTYQIQYKALGSPAVGARVHELLMNGGTPSAEDASRGFVYGTFVPLALTYPDADIPVVTLSIKSSYDAAEHIRLCQALTPLPDEGGTHHAEWPDVPQHARFWP
jgi:aromatic ring-opening dioxygenase catalytic subunit (LigB family)